MSNTPKSEPTEPIFSVAARVVGAVGSVFSWSVSAILLAYVVGWVEARAYFAEFGASWLVEQLPASRLLQFSVFPLVTIGFLTWTTLIDAAEFEKGSGSGTRPGTEWILRKGWMVLLLLMIGGLAADRCNYLLVANGFVFVTMIGFALYAAVAFERVLILVRRGHFVGDRYDAQLVYAIVFAGLYLVPTLSGRAQGRIDNQASRTSLPVVRLKPSDDGSLHALAIVDRTVYAVQLDTEDSARRSIRILPASDVFAIEQPRATGKPSTPRPTQAVERTEPNSVTPQTKQTF
jgi:hypothetical protein